jgi:hypothetical protein
MESLSIVVPFNSPYSMESVKLNMAYKLSQYLLQNMLDGKRRIVSFTPLISSIDSGFDVRFTLRIESEEILNYDK